MLRCLCHVLVTLLPFHALLHLTWTSGTGNSSPRWMQEEGRSYLCPILTRMGWHQVLLQRLCSALANISLLSDPAHVLQGQGSAQGLPGGTGLCREMLGWEPRAAT